jgi:hypothetical protein
MGVPRTPSFPIGVGYDTTEDAIERLLELLPRLATELQEVDAASSEALARFRAAGD